MKLFLFFIFTLSVFADTPLHPTGNFNELPPWPKKMPAQFKEFTVASAPDAEIRYKKFLERNNPQSHKALCLRLNEAIEASAPHLGTFRSLVKKKDYSKALDAYKEYFFAKLKNPEKYGAFTQNLTGYKLKSKKSHVFMKVDPKIVDLAMKGIYTFGDMQANVGLPGKMSWIPHKMKLPKGAVYGRFGNDHPFWKTKEGLETSNKIEFFRAMNKFPLVHMPMSARLITAWTLTGELKYLQRACEILDDRVMNSVRDLDSSPIDFRSATELETELLRDFPGMMRVMYDERPDFAKHFDSATLARVVLYAMDDFLPYTIRAKRTELANWGIMGIGNAFHLATFFQEFKCMTYCRRELWRLWNINFTQYFALDGTAYEAPDSGHSRIAVPRAREWMPYVKLPEVAGPMEQESFDDLLRVRMRYVTVQMTPRARQHPRFDIKYKTHPRYDWLKAKWTTFDSKSAMQALLWDNDEEVRNRMNTVMRNMGLPAEKGLPAGFSDVAPYGGMYFLRDSWEKDAEHFRLSDYHGASVALAMRYVSKKSIIFGRESGRFDLAKNGSLLAVGGGLAVDRKPCNFFHGKKRTGGKTFYCTEPARNIRGGRFHTSSKFDYAESAQEQPFYRPPEGVRRDSHFYNLYNVIPTLDNTPVTDVKTYRQVFALRGEGVYIVNTRIENSGSEEHEYSQFFALPTSVPAGNIEKAKKEVARLKEAGHKLVHKSSEKGFLATANLNKENVSIYLSASSPLKFSNNINSKGEFETYASQLDLMESTLELCEKRNISGKEFPVKWLSRQLRPVTVHWSGKGNQVLQSVLVTRKAGDEIKDPLQGGLKEFRQINNQDNRGCYLVTKNGSSVWFQSGPMKKNLLTAGPVKAEAESILVTEKEGVVSGMVIGADKLRINGKDYILKFTASEFSLQSGDFSEKPIRKPIDTVRISPQQTVFVDKVKVSFNIPGSNTDDLEFRYTLDGTDPTLQSTLYKSPFSIDQTVKVKVRAFRKGLKTTPWNFPGVDGGKTISAVYRKVEYRKPVKAGHKAGLKYEYLEGNWPELFMNAGSNDTTPVISSGEVKRLLDGKEVSEIRKSAEPYALRYSGYIEVPEDGVYVFHAPRHMLDVDMDAGFDLRIWVGGEEWYPEPGLHMQNTWSIALEKGLHEFKAVFVDYRSKKFKNEYWLSWQENQVWKGIPELKVSGPSLHKQAIPENWFKHK